MLWILKLNLTLKLTCDWPSRGDFWATLWPVSCSRRSLTSTRNTKKHWSDKGLFNRGGVPVLVCRSSTWCFSLTLPANGVHPGIAVIFRWFRGVFAGLKKLLKNFSGLFGGTLGERQTLHWRANCLHLCWTSRKNFPLLHAAFRVRIFRLLSREKIFQNTQFQVVVEGYAVP